MTKGKNCETCAFWAPTESVTRRRNDPLMGFCRRYPPILNPGPSESAVWPITRQDVLCTQYQPTSQPPLRPVPESTGASRSTSLSSRHTGGSRTFLQRLLTGPISRH